MPTENFGSRRPPRVAVYDVERVPWAPSASVASWWKLGAQDGVSTFLRHCSGPAGPESASGAFESLVRCPEHNFFAGQLDQKPEVATGPTERTGGPGHRPPPPLLPSHTLSGKLP